MKQNLFGREKNLCNRLDTNCIIKDDKLFLKLENNDNIIKLDVFDKIKS